MNLGFVGVLIVSAFMFLICKYVTKLVSRSDKVFYSKKKKWLISIVVFLSFMIFAVLVGLYPNASGFIALFVLWGTYSGLTQELKEYASIMQEQRRLEDLSKENELFNSVYIDKDKVILKCGFCSEELAKSELSIEEGIISEKFYCPQCKAKNIIVDL